MALRLVGCYRRNADDAGPAGSLLVGRGVGIGLMVAGQTGKKSQFGESFPCIRLVGLDCPGSGGERRQR